jgi:hypothetical protein
MWSVIRNAFRRTALAAFAGGVLLAGLGAITPESAQAATLYISEFATGVTNAPGSDQAQIPPQAAIADQTVALSGTTALSAAFNTKTHAIMLMCDEGCSVSFGTSSATATTSNYLLQQGVPYTFGVGPGQFVAAIANAAGNTSTGGGGAVTITTCGIAATDLCKAEDAVAASGDTGVAGLGVITNGSTSLASVGDYTWQGLDAAGNNRIVGSVASGATDSGDPVKVGGVYVSTNPTLTTGQRGNIMVSDGGGLMVQIGGQSNTGSDGLSNSGGVIYPTSTAAGTNNGTLRAGIADIPHLFNGTTFDRARSDANVTGAALTVPMPTTTAAAGITPVVSAALESNHVIKGSAGNLYAFSVTTGATAGFVLISNSTTAPTAGGAAIAPLGCYIIAANQTLGVTLNPPMAASTGITLVFSSSGCLTNTASTTAFFAGYAK